MCGSQLGPMGGLPVFFAPAPGDASGRAGFEPRHIRGGVGRSPPAHAIYLMGDMARMVLWRRQQSRPLGHIVMIGEEPPCRATRPTSGSFSPLIMQFFAPDTVNGPMWIAPGDPVQGYNIASFGGRGPGRRRQNLSTTHRLGVSLPSHRL
jgi:hypothetical protein